MSYAKPLLDTYPRTVNVDAGVLAGTIDALNDCAQACTADADDDLSEQNLTEMVKCIRLCLDCADVCTATVRVTSRQTDYDANVSKPLLEACVAACKSCGDECERHAQHSRALPRLRRGLPALRGGLPGAPGRHEIGDRPFRPVQFKRSRLWENRARAHRRLTGRTREFHSLDPVSRGIARERPPSAPQRTGAFSRSEIIAPARMNAALAPFAGRRRPSAPASPWRRRRLRTGRPGVQIGTPPDLHAPAIGTGTRYWKSRR